MERQTFPTTQLAVELLEDRLVLDNTSIGPAGIEALSLKLPDNTPLTGMSQHIGQVEGARPGKAGFDDVRFGHEKVPISDVFVMGTIAKKNEGTHRRHAVAVASVMVHTSDQRYSGVSPNATLHSSATE